MRSKLLCWLWLGAIPFVLGACTYPGPAGAEPSPESAAVGVDLGASSRIPRLAALAGDRHPMSSGAMPAMEHGAMADQHHGSMAGMPMDHGEMAGMKHGSTAGMPMDHGAMPGMSRSLRPHMQMAHEGHAHAQGTGTVNSVDASGHKINISHGPISAIGFPAMTMDFAVGPSVDLGTVKQGSSVKFTVEEGKDGLYVIQSIAPATGGPR